MDLGVGSFVFSLGLVSALPLLRRTDSNPYFTTIWRSFKKCLPLVVLGLVRVAMVKGVDYPVCPVFLPFTARSKAGSDETASITGTRLGVWRALELLLHPRPPPCFRGGIGWGVSEEGGFALGRIAR
jgi:hypothetical protein